ncbi:phosphopentomutase [Arthrobacter sp. MA-N2]|uniref:phosphopentomutase n=1 Tax=Arthrobacter sp. MA-N2 TaxID=1101188 RepID=UPI00048530FF|nr:phosphopentomutase [Arthrobacter sp. MA-N2]
MMRLPPQRRVVILVLDGFGVGALPDSEGQQPNFNTLRSIDETAGDLQLPILESLGLGNLTPLSKIAPAPVAKGAYGRCSPIHPGADTYLGHQELMGGGLDRIESRLLSELKVPVTEALVNAGYEVDALERDSPALVVDGCVLVADNIEAASGLNINVTGSLDDKSFDELTSIGQIVRAVTPVGRIIVVASRGFGIDEIRAHVKEKSPGQVGVDSPELGVYNEHYQVRHLGIEFDVNEQLPTRALNAGHEVVLLGKAADVVRCDGAVRDNVVDTSAVMAGVCSALASMKSGLVVANIQETDLAGHEQDAQRYAEVLERVDRHLALLLDLLGDEDVLFITADHGNDPSVGSSRHTREFVPLLVAGSRVQSVDLGTRRTSADIGATAATLLGVAPLGSGTSFEEEIVCF